jgi:hypothetical protein
MRDEQTPQQFRGMRGCVEVALQDAFTGKVVPGGYDRRVNAIATQGRAWALNALLSGEAASSQVLQQLAVGTDSTAPTTGDTALGSEVLRKAVGTWDTSGLTANPPYIRAQVQFGTDEANTTLNELGLFNSSSGSTMLGHATYSSKDKTTSNTLGVTYTISN